MNGSFTAVARALRETPAMRVIGEVRAVSGLALTVGGLDRALGIGGRCRVMGRAGPVLAEVIGADGGGLRVLPFGHWRGVTVGDPVEALAGEHALHPCDAWLGRVLDGLGRPLDGRPPPAEGGTAFPARAAPPPAFGRRRMGARIDTGVHAVDLFAPLCAGQRMGVFAGSGVGKSTLLAMLARGAQADVVVLGLVGERGREVQDFIQRDLGPDGMARAVVVVATGDEPPLMRRQAAWTATAVAEAFRDAGRSVLLLIDSVTRFAHAQREIGLAAGEPPAQRGYPPTVFAELPQLLERAGPGGGGQGDVTGLYTVLVDGDDMDDPVADGARGLLDGHVVLDRAVAERGRFPAVDLLRSVSRAMPGCHAPEEAGLVAAARRAHARHADMEDLIRMGAYAKGSDPEVDRALALEGPLTDLLRQAPDEAGGAVPFGALRDAMAAAGIGTGLSPRSGTTAPPAPAPPAPSR
ncbi:FliI/YscN family ATPase [Jannaschia sp. Os4]|uniref:FliI/YscN family ATPase n=1 Tax=Jannaschia sp. Os4 TaxID=2807617 RepID=UPI00193AC541|nr:FliI/YscN family ATPase [Jannaschia sp. Os4]MBM2575655.1 FliI/YscN family ATPase [Jannaschia sp. Os4]